MADLSSDELPLTFRVRPFKVRAVYGGNGFLRFAIVRHLHEPEATGLTRIPIRNDIDAENSAVSFEQRTDGLFGSAETEISNEMFFTLSPR